MSSEKVSRLGKRGSRLIRSRLREPRLQEKVSRLGEKDSRLIRPRLREPRLIEPRLK